jgi:hypothetical protein
MCNSVSIGCGDADSRCSMCNSVSIGCGDADSRCSMCNSVSIGCGITGENLENICTKAASVITDSRCSIYNSVRPDRH